MTGALLLGVAYGVEVKPKDDPYIKAGAQRHQIVQGVGSIAFFLVDAFPFCAFGCRSDRSRIVLNSYSETSSDMATWSGL